jgi:parvulin-like peptidyl-prolyl isomerase
MKKLVSFLICLFLSVSANAVPDIVAIVNNQPITAYDLNARKKMIKVINNVEDNTSQIDKQVTALALKSLIDEEILFDHAKTVKGKVTEQEIDDAISDIEQKNKMPKGHLTELLKSNDVSVGSFRSQIKSEIIKMNIISGFSRSINVTPREIDSVVLTDNQREVGVEAVVFVSNDKTDSTFAKMHSLQKKIKNCHNVKESLYNNFATKETYNQNISRFNPKLQAVMKDLQVNKVSNVIESDEGFKIVVLCKKHIKFLNDQENELVVNFLTNRKISQKAKEFLSNLHKKASIKIFI